MVEVAGIFILVWIQGFGVIEETNAVQPNPHTYMHTTKPNTYIEYPYLHYAGSSQEPHLTPLCVDLPRMVLQQMVDTGSS